MNFGGGPTVCRYFSTTGQCFYGEKCNFLHVSPKQPQAAAPAPEERAPVKAAQPRILPPAAGASWTSSPSTSRIVNSGSSFVPVGVPAPQQAQLPQPQLSNVPNVAMSTMLAASDPTFGFRGPQSFGAGPVLREEWETKRKAAMQPAGEKDPRIRNLANVGPFHSLAPLDDMTRDTTVTFFGYHSPVFRARHSGDGQLYLLRTLRAFRAAAGSAATALEKWRLVRHPSIVSLREAFVLEQGAGVDLHTWFVYDYHPAAKTLEATHFVSAGNVTFNEDILWSYICQLVSALRTIHAQGLACRCIYPSKILVTGKNRLRINGVGVSDVIHYDPSKIAHQQLDDLVSLGKLIMCLACRSAAAAQNIQRSLEVIGATFSAELKNLIIFLLSKGGLGQGQIGYTTIEDVVSRISGRMAMQMDNTLEWVDVLETQLGKEMDNGRLFRLITKLGFINERPEFDMDASWSETGDRYLLKLFRDYVFHQVYPDGSPVLNLSHVVDSLNRLDTGSPEKVPLVSRDHQTVLLCSFKDLKKCVDECFGDLCKKQKAFVEKK